MQRLLAAVCFYGTELRISAQGVQRIAVFLQMCLHDLPNINRVVAGGNLIYKAAFQSSLAVFQKLCVDNGRRLCFQPEGRKLIRIPAGAGSAAEGSIPDFLSGEAQSKLLCASDTFSRVALIAGADQQRRRVVGSVTPP